MHQFGECTNLCLQVRQSINRRCTLETTGEDTEVSFGIIQVCNEKELELDSGRDFLVSKHPTKTKFQYPIAY